MDISIRTRFEWALAAKKRVRKDSPEASTDEKSQTPPSASSEAVDVAAQLLVENKATLPSFFGTAPATPDVRRTSADLEPVDVATQVMVSQMEANEGAVTDPFERSMLDDIAEFKKERSRNVSPAEDAKNAQLKQVVSVLGTVLSFNFVIIISFFLWFVAGCVGKFAFEVRVLAFLALFI